MADGGLGAGITDAQVLVSFWATGYAGGTGYADIAAAEATLDSLPPEERDKPEVASLRSHLFFEGQIAEPATPQLASTSESLMDAAN